MSSGFKRALFGFKRKDVINYLEQIDVDHREEIQRAEKDGNLFEQKNAELLMQIKELTKRCDELAEERSVLIAQKETALTEKTAIESDMAELVETNQTLENKIYQLEAETDKVKNELLEKVQELEKLNAEQSEKLKNYEKLIAEREVQYTQALKQAEDAANAIALKQDELTAEKLRAAKLSAELQKAKADLETEKNRKIKIQAEQKKRDAVSAILSYVRKR